MNGDDFEYVLDQHGHRILVGLTPSEMVEFEQLDKLRRDSSTGLPLISAEGHLQPRRGKRWLELSKTRTGTVGFDRSAKRNQTLTCSNRTP